MKLKLLTSGVMLLMQGSLLFGQDRNAIFQEQTPITWLGLDFTGASFVGDEERFTSDEVVYNLVESLNKLMLEESEKFNIPKAFEKTNVKNALDITSRQNGLIKAESLRGGSLSELPRFTPDIIQEIVSRYDFEGRDGIGLMFNIESFNKIAEQGSVWITFVDMGAGKVIMTERLIDEPGGFGLRNYWAGCIYGMLKQIRKRELSSWRKKYYRG